jgi:hypothetical protein
VRYLASGVGLRTSHRTSLRGAVATLLVLGVTTSLAGRALATPDDPDADTLINRGLDLREHGKDDEALAVFKKALAKSPSPRARAQVALAEQALGLWTSAESDLLLCLSAADDPWITKNRGAIEGALAVVRRHLGSLEIRGTQGAEVLLDGVRLGALPATAPFRVEAGRRTLELRAKGFHSTARNVEIAPGSVTRETVMLVALTPDSGGEPGASGEPGAGGPRDRAVPVDSDPGHGQRVLGWAFATTGAALLVTGGVSMMVRKGIIDDYNNNCPGLGVNQPPDCDGKIASSRTWLTVAIVSLVGGGIFAIGGLTVVATAPSRSTASAGGVRIGCAPSSLGDGATLGCAGTF